MQIDRPHLPRLPKIGKLRLAIAVENDYHRQPYGFPPCEDAFATFIAPFSKNALLRRRAQPAQALAGYPGPSLPRKTPKTHSSGAPCPHLRPNGKGFAHGGPRRANGATSRRRKGAPILSGA